MGTINSELRKVFTLKWWWVLCLILAVVAAGIVALNAWQYDSLLSDPALEEARNSGQIPGLDDPRTMIESVYRSPLMFGYLLAFTGGALVAGNETAHKTWTATFTAVPRRWSVLGGKVVAAIVVALLTGLTHLVVAVGFGAALTGVFDALEPFPEPAQLAVTLGTFVVAHVLWALLGLGLALLTNSTLATVIIGFVATLIGDNVIAGLAFAFDWVGDVARYLPGPVTGALTRSDAGGVWDPLEPWAGGLALAAYAAVALLLGGLRRARKDVD
ncbi:MULTISPECIES: ABC transporter permease subunit [Kytococcus]|uniref:ABC transporter permease n=1 Tax=Kytococcus schroeteri TaxID=138300 RepID=A0A2I1PD48_9MICO|nr:MULTISPECIES: ABC transporter permease subunit [Kytococcus]OFS15031.1 hypothetical protein HMPREF3099_03020 [Kytococcus sp. HMSC28H12]PKZ42562.1 hypothetical protein CYJ76_01450 [Kytococcus schroeteri]